MGQPETISKKVISQKKRYSLKIRSIALLLVAAFFFQDVAHAAPALEQLFPDVVHNPHLLRISSSAARIQEVHRGQKPRLIIHIQDAHTNTSAQRNIAAVLEELIRRYRIRTVFVEGGTRDDSLTFLRPLASKAVRERVSKKYLMAGELNGAEYWSLASDDDMKIQGVEERPLYQRNLETYAGIVSKREKILAYLNDITGRFPALKRRLYPADLYAFDEAVRRFEAKESDFTDYYAELLEQASERSINLLAFPNILVLKSLKARETEIDFEKANLEQENILKVLSEKDPQDFEEIHEFLTSLEKIKFHSRPPVSFYEKLLAAAKKEGVAEESCANLSKYLGYLKLYASVNMTDFLSETRTLEEEIFKSSLTDRDAYTLHEIDGYLKLLKNLFSLEITAENFDAYYAKKSDVRFETVMMLAFLNRRLYEFGRTPEVIRYLPLIEENKKEVEDFYRTTKARDDVFIGKTLRHMDEKNLEAAVLLTGGYHTPNLKSLLEQNGVSYVIVTPVVSNETDTKRYEKLLLAQLGSSNPLTKPVISSGSDVSRLNLLFAAERPHGPVQAIQAELTALSGARLAASSRYDAKPADRSPEELWAWVSELADARGRLREIQGDPLKNTPDSFVVLKAADFLHVYLQVLREKRKNFKDVSSLMVQINGKLTVISDKDPVKVPNFWLNEDDAVFIQFSNLLVRPQGARFGQNTRRKFLRMASLAAAAFGFMPLRSSAGVTPPEPLSLAKLDSLLTEEKIMQLIEKLRSDDEEEVQKARKLLTERGKEAVPYLVSGFKAEIVNPGVNRKAIRGHLKDILVLIGKPAVPAAVTELQNEHYLVHQYAAGILKTIGKDAVPDLIGKLSDKNDDLRNRSALILTDIGKDAVPDLVKTLEQKNWTVVALSLAILGRIGDSSATGAVSRTLERTIQFFFKDPDSKYAMCAVALETLARIADASAIPTIERLYKLQKDDWKLRSDLIESLGRFSVRIKKEAELKKIISFLADSVLADPDNRVHTTAVDALSRLDHSSLNAVFYRILTGRGRDAGRRFDYWGDKVNVFGELVATTFDTRETAARFLMERRDRGDREARERLKKAESDVSKKKKPDAVDEAILFAIRNARTRHEAQKNPDGARLATQSGEPSLGADGARLSAKSFEGIETLRELMDYFRELEADHSTQDRLRIRLSIREASGKVTEENITVPLSYFRKTPEEAAFYAALLIAHRGNLLGATTVGYGYQVIGSDRAPVDLSSWKEEVVRILKEDFGNSFSIASFGKGIQFVEGDVKESLSFGNFQVRQATQPVDYVNGEGIGFDVGGTHLKMAYKTGASTPSETFRFSVPKESLAEFIEFQIRMHEDRYSKQNKKSFGDRPIIVTVPGTVTPDGRIVDIPNFKEAIGQLNALQGRIPNIRFQNDANTAAFYQMTSRGLSGNAIVNTLGTGLGLGIVMNGRLIEGPQEAHLKTFFGKKAGRRSGFGMPGDVEAYTNKTFVLERAIELLKMQGVGGEILDVSETALANGKFDPQELTSWLEFKGEGLDQKMRRTAEQVYTELGNNLALQYLEISRVTGMKEWKVVLVGGLVSGSPRSRELILSGIQKAIASLDPSVHLDVRVGEDSEFSGALGSLNLGIQAWQSAGAWLATQPGEPSLGADGARLAEVKLETGTSGQVFLVLPNGQDNTDQPVTRIQLGGLSLPVAQLLRKWKTDTKIPQLQSYDFAGPYGTKVLVILDAESGKTTTRLPVGTFILETQDSFQKLVEALNEILSSPVKEFLKPDAISPEPVSLEPAPVVDSVARDFKIGDVFVSTSGKVRRIISLLPGDRFEMAVKDGRGKDLDTEKFTRRDIEANLDQEVWTLRAPNGARLAGNRKPGVDFQASISAALARARREQAQQPSRNRLPEGQFPPDDFINREPGLSSFLRPEKPPDPVLQVFSTLLDVNLKELDHFKGMIHPSLEAVQALNEEIPADSQKRLKILAILKEKAAQGGIAREVFLEAEKSRWAVFPGYAAEKETKLFYRDGRVSEGMLLFTKDFLDDLSPAAAAEYVLSEMSGDRLNAGRENANWKNYLAKWLERRLVPEKFTQLLYQLYRIHYKIKLGKYNAHLGEGRDHPEYAADDVLVTQLANQLGLTGAKNNYEVLKLLYRRGVLEAVYTHAMHQAIHALRRDDYAVVREYKTLVEVLANMIYIGASQKEAPGWFARGEAQYNAEVDHKVQGWTDTQKDMALRIQTALGKLNNDPETVPQLKSAHVVLKEFGEFMDYIQSIRNSFNLSEYITGLEEKHSALKLEFENAVNGVLDRWLLLIEEKIEKIEGLIGFIDRLRLDVLRRQVPAQGGVEAIVNFSNARVLLAELDVLRRKSEELGAFLEGENREKITQIIQKTDKARLFYGQKLSTVKGIVGESEKPVSPPVPVPPKGFERQVAPVLPQARASLSQTTSKNSTASHGVSKHVNPSEPTITSREEVTGLVLQSQRMSAQSSQMAKIEAALSEESPQWIPIRGMITQMVELGAQDLDQVSPGFKSRLAAKIFLSLERALENDDPDWPGLDVILRGAAEIGVGDIGGMTPRKHLEYFGEMKKAWVLNRLQTALSEEPVHSKRVTALLEKAAAYGVKDPVINRTKSRISGEPADGARPERGALAPSRGARLSTVKILIADTPVTGARLAHARVAKVAAYTKLPRQTVATRRRFMGRDLRKLGKKHGHFWLEGIRVQGRPRSRLGVGLELYVPHLSNTSGNKRTVYNLPKKYKDRPIDMAVDAFGFPYWIGIKPDRKRPYGFRKFFKRILVRREDGKIKEVLGAALLDVMLADILNAVQLANRLNGDAVVTRLDVKKNMPRSDSRKFTVGRQRIFIEAEDARGLPDRLYGEVIYDKTKKRKPVPRTLLVGVYRSDDPDDPASGELQVLRRFTLVKHPTLPDYYVVRDKELERWKSRLYRHYLSLVRTMSVFQAVSRLLETPGIPEKLKDLNVLGEAFSRLGTRALYLGKHYPLWLETEAVGIADLYGFYLSFGRSKELFRGFLREVIGPGLQLLSVSDEIFYKVVQKSKSPDSRPVSDWVITRLRRNARSKRVEAEAQSSREEKLRQFSEIDPEVFLDTVVRNNLNHWSKVIHVSNRPAVSEIRGLLEPKFRETAKQVFKQAVNEWEPQNSVKLKNYAARKVAVALYDAAKEVKGEIEERLRRLTTKASVDFTSAAVWRQKTGGARLAKQPGEPADGARPERGALAPSRGARLSTVKILIADKPAGDETIDAIRALVSSFGDRVELINTVGIGKDETALKAIIEKEKPAVILIRSATKAFSKEAMLRLAKANGLRAIIRAGAGVDNVDLAKAEKNDIAVIRTHGNANSVANLNLRFLIASLAGSKKIPSDGQDVSESGRFREIFDVSLGEFLEAEEKSEKGRMSKSDREAVLSPLSEHELLRRLKTLKGKTIGLAGFGPVAQAFAGKLEKLREITGVQFRVIATSPSLYNRRSDRMVLAQKLGVEPVFEGEVWTESDILSLHLPAEAAGSADVLGRTAKNPHLKAILNSSRQALLLLPALEKFLSERPDLRYFADVDMDSDLEAFHERFEGRAFISPHIAASTKNAARGVEEKVLTTLEATVRKLLGEPTDFEPTMMNHVLLRAFARMDFNNLQEELRTRNDGDARLEQIAVRSLYHASSSLKGLDSLMNYLMVLGLNLADNNLDHPLVKKIENLADDFRKIRAEVERQFSMTDVSGRPDLQKTLGDLRDRFDGLIPELPVLTESESRKEFKRLWAQIIQVLDDRIELMKGLSGDAGTSAFKDVWQIRGEEDRLKSLEAAVDEEAARQTLPLSRIRLFSVLVNLAANASKHGDGNGHVRLSVGFEGNDRSKVVIKVSNTETERIPPEYFEKTPGARRIRLFELEQRPWGPSSRIPVGLAEVYDTVAIAGGEISIEETGEAGVPGGTVEFTVRIPVMSAEKARSTAERIWKGEEEPVWRKNLTLPVLEQIIFIHAREIREFVSPDERRRRSEKIKGIFDTSVLNAAEKSGKFPDLDFKLLRGYLLAPIESSKQPLAGEAETGDYLLKLAKTASAGPKESRALDQFVKFLAFVTEAWAEAVLLAAQRSENEYDAVYFSDIYIRFLIIEIEGIPVFHELSGEIRDVHSFVDTVFYAFQSLKDRNNQHYDLAHFGNTGTQQSFYANLIFSILLEQPKLNPRLEKVLKTLNPSFPSPNDAEFRFIRLNKSIRRAMAFPGDLVVPAQEAPVQAGARFAHASRSAFRDYVQAIWEMGQYQPKEALALVLWTVPVMLFFPAIVSLLDWRQSVWPKSTALLPSESDEVKTESDEVKIRALEMAFGDLVTKVFNEERRRTKNFTLSLWTSKGKEGSTIYDFSDAGGSETSLAPVYSGFAKRNTLAVSFIPRRPFEASMLDLNSSIPALPLPERLKDLSRVFGRELAHFAREEKIRFVHHLDPSASWPGIVITNWRLGVRRSVEFYLRQLDAPLVRHSVVRSANPSFDPTDLLDILDKAGAEEVRNRLLMIRGELEREPTIQRTPFQTRLIETIDTALSQIPPRTEFLGFESGARLAVGSAKSLSPASPAEGNGQYLPAAGKQRVLLRVDSKHIEATIIDSQGHIVRSVNPIATDDWRKAHEAYRDFVSRMRGDNPKRELKRVRIKLQNHVIHRVAEQLRKLLDDESVDFDSIDAILIESQGSFSSTGKLENDLDALSLMRETDFLGKVLREIRWRELGGHERRAFFNRVGRPLHLLPETFSLDGPENENVLTGPQRDFLAELRKGIGKVFGFPLADVPLKDLLKEKKGSEPPQRFVPLQQSPVVPLPPARTPKEALIRQNDLPVVVSGPKDPELHAFPPSVGDLTVVVKVNGDRIIVGVLNSSGHLPGEVVYSFSLPRKVQESYKELVDRVKDEQKSGRLRAISFLQRQLVLNIAQTIKRRIDGNIPFNKVGTIRLILPGSLRKSSDPDGTFYNQPASNLPLLPGVNLKGILRALAWRDALASSGKSLLKRARLEVVSQPLAAWNGILATKDHLPTEKPVLLVYWGDEVETGVIVHNRLFEGGETIRHSIGEIGRHMILFPETNRFEWMGAWLGGSNQPHEIDTPFRQNPTLEGTVNITALEKKYRISALENIAAEKERIALAPAGQLGQALGAYLKSIRAQFGEYLFPQEIILTGPVNDLDPKIREGVQRGFEEEMKRPRNEELGYRHGLEKRYGDWAAQVTADPARREELSRLHGAFYVENYLLAQGIAFRKNPAQGLSVHVSAERARRDNAGEVRPVQVVLSYERDGRKENARLILHRPESETLGETAESILRLASERVDLHQRPDAIHSPLSDILRIELDMPLTVQVMKAEATVAEVKKVQDTPPLEAVVSAGTDDDKTPAKTPAVPPSQPSDDGLRRELFTPAQVLEHLRRESQRIPLDNFDHRKYGLPMKGSEFLKIMPYLYQAKVSLKFDPAFSHFSQKSLDDGTKKLRALGEAIGKLADPDEIIILLEQNSLLILLGKFTVSPLIAREIFWKALHFCLSPEFLKESTADVSTGKITRSEASRGARAAISPPAAPARLTRHLTGARLASTHSHAVIFEELQSVLVKSKRFEKIPTARSIQKLHVVSIRDTSGLKEVWFNPGGENGPTIHFFHKNPSEPAKRESVDVSFYGNKSKVSLSLGDGAFDDYLFREKKLQDPVEPKSHLVKAGFIEDAFYLVVTREFFDYYSRDPKVMGKIGSWIVPEDDARAGKVTLSLKAAETPRDILEEEVTPPKITAEKAPRARSRSEKPEIRLDPEQYRKFLEWLTKFDPDKNKRVADFLNQILQMTEPQEVRRGFRRSGFKNTFVPRFIRTLEDEGINVYKLGKPQFETFLAFARFLVKKPEVEKIIRSWKTRAGARLADLGSVASAFKHRHTSNTGAFFLENDAEPVLLTPSETRTNPPTVEFIESLKPRIVSVLEEEKIPKPTDVAERVIRILVHLYDAKKSSGATRGSRAAISPPAAPARLTRHLAGARLTTQPVEPSLGADGAWLAGTGEPKHSGAIYDVIREIAEASHLFDWRFSWADPSVRLLLVFDDASLVSHKSDFSVFIASVIGQTRSFEKSKAVFDILTAFTGKNEHVTLKILEEVAPLIVRAVVEEIINSGGDLVIALIEKGLVASRDDFEEAIRVIQERKETKPDAPEIFLLWEREALRAVLSRKVSVLADLEKVDLPAIGSSETTAAMKEGSPKVFNALVQEARELLEQLKTQSDFRNFSPSVHDSPDQAPLVLRRKIRQFLRELEEMKLNLTVDGKADGEIVVRPDKGSDPREASRNLQSLLVGDMKKRFGLDLDPAENAPDQIFNGSFYTQVTLVCRNPELFEAIQNELSHEWARGQDESLGVESPQPRLPVDLARLVEVQKVRGNQKDPNMTALPPSPAPIPSSQTASRAPSKDRPVPVPTPAEPNTNPPLSMNGRISELVTDFTRHIGGLTFVKGGDVNFHADLLRGIVLDYPDEIQTIVEELVKKVELNLSLVGVRGLESAAVLYLLNYALLQWKENPVKQNEAVGLLSGRRDFFEKINHSYDGSDKTKVHLAVLGLLSHLKVKKSEPSADPKEKRRKALNQLAWKVITSAKDIPQALENFKTVYLQGEPAAIQSAVNELTALLNFDTLSRDDARINLGVLLVLTDLPNAYKTLSVLQKAAGVMAYSRSKGEEFKKPLYGTVRFQAVRFFESITDLTPEMESLKNQVLTLKLKRWPPLAEKSVAPRDSQLEAPPAGARAAISPPAAPTRLTRHLTGARLAEMTPEERTREAIKKSKLALANSPQRDRLAYESFLNAYLEAVKLEALFKSSSNLLFNGSFPFAIVDAIVGPVDLHLQAATNATLNFDTTLGAINNPAVIRHFLAFFSPPVERLAIPYVEKASSRLAQLEKSGARLAVSSADELKRAELHRVLRQLEQHPVLSRQPSVSDVVLAVRTGWANTSVEKASSQLLAVIRTLPEELMIGVGISEILDTLEVLSKPSKPGAEPILVPRTDREVENSLGRELVYFVKRSFPNGISPREIDGLGQSYEIPILIEIQPNGNISNIFEETPAGFVQKPDTVVYRAAYNLETKRIQILPDIHQKSLKIVRYVVYHQLKQVVESYNAKLPRFSVPPAGVKAQPPLEDGPTPEGARLAAEETKTVAARLAAEVRAEKTPATYPVLVQARPVFFVLQAVPAGVGVSAVPVFLPFDGVTSPPIFTGTFSRNQLTEIRANSAQSKFGLRDGSFNAYEMVTGTSAKVWNEIFKALNGEGGAASGSITAFTLPAEILSTERDLAETLKVLDAIARARGNAFKFVLTYRAGETAPDAAALEKLSSQNVMLEAVEIKAGRTVSEAVLDRVPPDRLGQLVMAADLADIEHRPETLGVREASEKLHERVRLVGIERPVGLHSPISISEMVQAGLSALFGIPVSSALGLKEIHTVFGPIYVVTALVDQEIAQVRHARESERSA